MADEAALKSLFGQLASALSYMHKKGFCHRDIKPENVVLLAAKQPSEPVAKLIDFGLAEDERFVQGRVGTDAYAAPEVAAIVPGEFVDGFAADVWSLGMILVVLLSGRIPWAVASPTEDADFKAFVERHDSGCSAAVFQGSLEALGLTHHLAALLDSMLYPDPALRPAMDEVVELLALPWIEHSGREDQEDMYTYRLPSMGDSGCSWGDISPEDEVDFASLPLPSFEPVMGEKAAPFKSDSGVMFR